MSARSLQVQQQGIEVAGNNLANVNNPAYSRQRVVISTATTIEGANGFLEGTGADVSNIQQIRDAILDGQMISENGVTGSLDAQQQALQYAQSNLGQSIDSNATGAAGSAAASVSGGQHGIGDAINSFFDSVQGLSGQASAPEKRTALLNSAQQLADRFRQTDKRLADLNSSLNDNVSSDVDQANSLLSDIAQLNQDITRAEASGKGTANDLRDQRQAKLEDLGKLVKFDATPADNGAVNVSVGGVMMVEASTVQDKLQAYDAGNNKTMVRAATAGTSLDITSGHIQGLIEARDGAIQQMRDNLSTLASTMITQINQLHQSGYGTDNSTGLDFFQGSDASDIKVNQALIDDPAKIAASGKPDTKGDNTVIHQIAQLATATNSSLNNQTFSGNYNTIVGDLGTSLSSVNKNVSDQAAVSKLVLTQRDSVSGVSVDEEMTDLMKYQRAYQASAQVVNVVNTMLDSVLNMVH